VLHYGVLGFGIRPVRHIISHFGDGPFSQSLD